MIPLPIDSHIPAILSDNTISRIIVSTPGSGKTTRVPPAILSNASKKVLCVEPRRIACIAAASRVAEEQGWQLGKEVGYHVRLEKKCTSTTRLVFVTNGMLLQYLCADPFLDDYSEIIFDEFHERSIEADISIAMCRYLQHEARDDLRLTIMSATLDYNELRQWLSPCSVFDIKTPVFPLSVQYIDRPCGSRLGDYIDLLIAQCRSVMDKTQGDCLVFLPGLADIRAAIERASAEFGDLYDYIACHASLPLSEQRQILNPGTSRRRLIFSTNVAESSLTIPRVRAVIDSGFAKRKFFDSVSGLSRLETLRISRASADQRAGRAARLGPGICVRLWNDQIQNQLETQTSPEIDHLDLCQAYLQILMWGLEEPENLSFFTKPAEGRLRDARDLLINLGALDNNGLTDLGKQMAHLPVEPRLARWLIAAAEFHCVRDTALLAAFLSEAPYRRSQRERWPYPDLFEDCIRLSKEINKPENQFLKRIFEDILSAADELNHLKLSDEKFVSDRSLRHERLARAMLTAYRDRLAQPRPAKEKLDESDPRRNTTPVPALMSGNRGVVIKEPYSLKDAKFFICADLDLVRGVARAASTVVKALEVRQEWIPWREDIVSRYESAKDRVVVARAVHYDIFTLRETFLHDEAAEKIARKTLLSAALKSPADALNFNSDKWLAFSARLEFLKKLGISDIPEFDMSWGMQLLPSIAANAKSFADLRSIELSQHALGCLPPHVHTALRQLAPERVVLENGFETDVDYTMDPPVIRVKIQKAFGTFKVPRIGGGKVPVMVHLCAPNGRAAQVTQDLDSFWRSTYTDVRKLLRGRYPKHDWPEIPPGITK